MSPSPDPDRRPRERHRSPRRRSRSPDLYPPITSESRQKCRSRRRRSRDPDSHRSRSPHERTYQSRSRREKVAINERLVIDLVTPEPELTVPIPVADKTVIEEISAANIFHYSQTYTVPVEQRSLSTIDLVRAPSSLPIPRQAFLHEEEEQGIHRIAAAFRGPESECADRISTTFADAFGTSRKLDLISRPPTHLSTHLPPHSHPSPYRGATPLKEADCDTLGGPPKPDLSSQTLSHPTVSPTKDIDLDINAVPGSSRYVIAKNPEPFSGTVVNDLNRFVAKRLASEMLDTPLYKDGVYHYIFWTDGSFLSPNNGSYGGAAAVWLDPGCLEWHAVREKPPYLPTNSDDPELLGIVLALSQASSFIAKFQRTHPSILDARHEVFVFTDSSASLHMITRAHLTPLYTDLVRDPLLAKILETGAALKRLGVHTQLHWVPGHSDVLGNEIADREAKKAAYGKDIGRQVSSGQWIRPSSVSISRTTDRTTSHTTRKHEEIITRVNALLRGDDYVPPL
ncbi:hypothetical protein N7507_002350 [Penicillium longicatenatum]|nr:hypothetical protein N7507_002350 [Penicillium longicatenatum]